MKIKLFAAAAFLALGAAAAPAMAQDIDTTGNAYGEIGPFGVPDTATYGQTFTVGSATTLNSFSMYLLGSPSNEVDFRAYLYAWDGEKAVGDELFRSAIKGFVSSGTPQEFTFDTTGLTLDSGSRYVAFLSTSEVQIERPNSSALMPLTSNVYAGGDFVFYNNGHDFAALTSHAWDMRGGWGDAYFKADFSASAAGVPEPAAWGMMIGGFGFAGGALRARSRKVRFAAA